MVRLFRRWFKSIREPGKDIDLVDPEENYLYNEFTSS